MKASRAVGLLVACLAVCTCAEAAARSGPAGRARLLLATPALSYGQVYSQLNATEADVLQFVDSLDGTLVLAGQPQYGRAKNLSQVVNMFFNSKTPATIVYAASERDVAATVLFASERRLPLCVRAGGHDTSGASICNGVVVDVTALDRINVFPEKKEAVVQAGVRFQDLVATLQPHGMDAVHGLCNTVGISGWSLGGGWGMMSKQKGLGVDNLLALTVALTNGTIVEADEAGEHSELFWALRGAGHQNFGVVTSMRYRIFPAGGEVVQYNATFDAAAQPELAAKALLLYQTKFLDKGPASLLVFPNFVSNRETGTQVLVVYATLAKGGKGAEKELQELMEPFEALGPAVSGIIRMPWANMSRVSDPAEDLAFPNGVDGIWEVKRGEYVDRPLDLQEMRNLLDGWLSWPAYPANYTGPQITFAYLEGYEGAITDKAANATAFVHRGVGFDIVTDLMMADDPSARQYAEAHLAEIYDQQWKGMLNGQAYQNYPTVAYQPPSVALEKYYGSNLCRLVAVKRRYDPQGVFKPEQGVPLTYPGCE